MASCILGTCPRAESSDTAHKDAVREKKKNTMVLCFSDLFTAADRPSESLPSLSTALMLREKDFNTHTKMMQHAQPSFLAPSSPWIKFCCAAATKALSGLF